ncbi:MAG: NADPH-dependent glutamate synthase [Planctomycetota bacterium]|jgi:glutamate synthase (NADPH/NADH) small chain|nr:NADPH-dependent glutamate synthase [Planctomycetota bacterium]
MSHVCHGNAANTYEILNTPDAELNRVRRKENLSDTVRLYEVYVPAIAAWCAAGQFIVARGDETGERIPLTIADFDRAAGTITLVMQIVGRGSQKLDALKTGDRFASVVGPLGAPSEIENFGTVAIIGGGLGIAPIYPIARALKEAGNKVIAILGARNASLIFWDARFRQLADQTLVVTDDGSAGEKGFVTTALEKLILAGERVDRVIAIGPPIMMKVVCDLTRKYSLPTVVSLNALMVDGTGMCGCCRVEVGGATKFTCVDGPDFDGLQVNWDSLFRRLKTYQPQERAAFAPPPAPAGRTPMPELPPLERIKSFAEVALGYTPAMAAGEARRCIQCKKPQCVTGCPVKVDIPAFIREIQNGDFAAAATVIKRTNNLPAICGRVCPQESQCEKCCVLGKKGEPVAIGRLERFAADYDSGQSAVGSEQTRATDHGERPTVHCPLPTVHCPLPTRIAVVGAGPAGLSCAADLAKAGHRVTVFEALHAPGGVLAYGIPEFRLPKAIVRRECDNLKKLGVVFRLDFPVGLSAGVPDLFAAGYDAVFIGTGAGLPAFMNIPGENLNGVYSANEFLTRVNLMKAYRDDYDTPVLRGKNVAVIGGGNVAMDAARSALRLGAETVHLVYRRTRTEMPARAEEVHHALDEGVQIRELANPVEVLGDENGWVRGAKCQVMRLGEPDAKGRRRPEPTDEFFTLPLDQFIVAIGQGPNPVLTRNWSALRLTPRGNIVADEATGATNIPRVFAGGDIVTGAATVILAMGAGKAAAAAIHAELTK